MDKLTELRKELQQLRQQSLDATRKGEWFKVAQLTTKTHLVNNKIWDIESSQTQSSEILGLN